MVRSSPESGKAHLDYAKELRLRSRQLRASTLGGQQEESESIALAREALHHFLEAEEILRLLLEEADGAEQESLDYAECLVSIGRGLEARRILRELTERDPPSRLAMVRLASLLAGPIELEDKRNLGLAVEFGPRIERRDEALDLMGRAIELAPEDGALYLKRAGVRVNELSDLIVAGRLKLEALELVRNDIELAWRYRAVDPHTRVWSLFCKTIFVAVDVGMEIARAGGVDFDIASLVESGDWGGLFEGAGLLLPGFLDLEQRASCSDVLDELEPYLEDEELGLVASTGTALASLLIGRPDSSLEQLERLGGFVEAGFAGSPEALSILRDLIEGASLLGSDSEDAQRDLFDRARSTALQMINGDEALRDGEVERARQVYRRALAGSPSHPKAWLGLGMCALRGERDLATARSAFERAAQGSSTRPQYLGRAHFGLFLVAWKEGDWREAADRMVRALGALPDHAPLHLARARFLGRNGEWESDAEKDSALRSYLRAAELYMDAQVLQTSTREFLLTREREPWMEARDCLDEASELLEGWADAPPEHRLRALELRLRSASTFGVGDAVIARRRVVDALRSLERLRPLNEEELIGLAQHLLVLADSGHATFEEALEACDGAIARSFGRIPAHLELLSRIALRLERPEEAVAALLEAVRVGRAMWGTEVAHRDLDHIERQLSDLLYPLFERAQDAAQKTSYRAIPARSDLRARGPGLGFGRRPAGRGRVPHERPLGSLPGP